MNVNELDLRLQIVELIAAEALARTFTDEPEMLRWTGDCALAIERAAEKRGVMPRSYQLAWDQMLTLVRRQFARERPVPGQ